jgi:hypothetical protein
MAYTVRFRVNGINYTIQQQSSGMRDSDVAAANIQPLPADKRLNGSTAWMEQTLKPAGPKRRYTRGSKIRFGKASNVQTVPGQD